jgi:hypothetical protein
MDRRYLGAKFGEWMPRLTFCFMQRISAPYFCRHLTLEWLAVTSAKRHAGIN